MSGKARKLRVLFVCTYNLMRSPTAERIFSDHPRLDVKSAGVDDTAVVTVTEELLEWAELVFVMESQQRTVIQKKFRDLSAARRVICLYIPDDYDFMDPGLVELFTERVTPHLEEALASAL